MKQSMIWSLVTMISFEFKKHYVNQVDIKNEILNLLTDSHPKRWHKVKLVRKMDEHGHGECCENVEVSNKKFN